MPLPEQDETSRRRPARTIAIVLTLLCAGVVIAMLAPSVLLFIGFHQAMSSFGPSHGPTQPSRIVELVGFLVIGVLPLTVYVLCRALSRRKK